VENRLKELHHRLEMDRTSGSRFLANQFRVLLTLAAYILFQELQRRARGTACADAQVTTLRERLLKLAVWVERSVRRIVLHLPTNLSLALDVAAPRACGRRHPLRLPGTSAHGSTPRPVSRSRAPSASAPAPQGANLATPVALTCRHRRGASRSSPYSLSWGRRNSQRPRS